MPGVMLPINGTETGTGYHRNLTKTPPVRQDVLSETPQKEGAVLHCLVDNIGITHVACAEETVRAVHSALQFYQPVP